MRLVRLIPFALSMICAVPLAIVAAVERAAVALFTLIAPERREAPMFSFGLPSTLSFAGPAPLDPALLTSLRHEAGMRPLPG